MFTAGTGPRPDLDLGPNRAVVEVLDEGAPDLVPDAVIAAVAIEHGCEFITLDRDFARFGSVRHRRPLASSA